jgi:predicted nucleic acid-binding protein
MRAVFADTSFYVAVLNSRDAAHVKAQAVGESIRRPVLLTDFVLLELGNSLSRLGERKLFTGFVRRLRARPNVSIVPASRELLNRGFELFSRRDDKEWSLTDCTSFVVMQDEELTDALTTDHHFEQAGFTALLR